MNTKLLVNIFQYKALKMIYGEKAVSKQYIESIPIDLKENCINCKYWYTNKPINVMRKCHNKKSKLYKQTISLIVAKHINCKFYERK